MAVLSAVALLLSFLLTVAVVLPFVVVGDLGGGGGARTLRLRLTESTEWLYCNTSTIKYSTH